MAKTPGNRRPEEVQNTNPYDRDTKKGEQVEKMFDSIAPAYDFMNNAMTLGLHRRWRDRALEAALDSMPLISAPAVLDVATGTGDVAFRLHELLPQAKIIGIDLSAKMLDVARAKLKSMPPKTAELMSFGRADCLALPYTAATFDLITVAYGVRNFENLLQGLREMRRVLKPDGVLCIVELSCPEGRLTSLGYRLYTKTLIPAVGKLVSGDPKAYTYLPESIAAAPQRGDMARLLARAGFTRVQWKSLTFGAVTYYLAR